MLQKNKTKLQSESSSPLIEPQDRLLDSLNENLSSYASSDDLSSGSSNSHVGLEESVFEVKALKSQLRCAQAEISCLKRTH